MKITMVKKVLADGQPCDKCIEIEKRLRKNGYNQCITRTVCASENDPYSEGSMLASLFQVPHAPFFIVEAKDQKAIAYTSYLKLVKEVLKSAAQQS